MNVAVLGETLPGEDRVALIPASVSKLEKLGCEVTVVSGAGLPSHFSDEEYREAGATIAPDAGAALQGAGVVLKVQAPTDEEVAALPEGVVLISLLSPLTQPELIGRLASAKVSASRSTDARIRSAARRNRASICGSRRSAASVIASWSVWRLMPHPP